MDTTAIGISVGLLVTGMYSSIRATRQRSFDLGATLLTFLAGFSIPGGAVLILAAWSGNPQALPSSWREYVTVAGVAAIGLSIHYLAQAFRNVWPPRASLTPPNDQGALPSNVKPDS
jgi:hypothetical protein